jgi:glycosyltransferase involved in cell wall biosynthesis
MDQAPDDRLRILHITTGLKTGGAEIMLQKLLCCRIPDKCHVQVISLTGLGEIGKSLIGQGITVRHLGMNPVFPGPLALIRLARWIKEARPDVVQTWMYHADLIGGLVAFLCGFKNIVWNIRQTNVDSKSIKRRTILVAKLCAKLSHLLPKQIICNSSAGRDAHIAIGYASEKFTIIPNGFDLELFRPDIAAYKAVRKQLGVSAEVRIIGIIARYDRQKDHQTFLHAAEIHLRSHPDTHFLYCGEGMTAGNPAFANSLKNKNLRNNSHFLGFSTDIPRLTAALDIAVSSSIGEGFANNIGEAMASGVPCSVTDVGDSALIVGDFGWVVPPQSPTALAKAWGEIFDFPRIQMKETRNGARRRMIDNFGIEAIANQYHTLYETYKK